MTILDASSSWVVCFRPFRNLCAIIWRDCCTHVVASRAWFWLQLETKWQVGLLQCNYFFANSRGQGVRICNAHGNVPHLAAGCS